MSFDNFQNNQNQNENNPQNENQSQSQNQNGFDPNAFHPQNNQYRQGGYQSSYQNGYQSGQPNGGYQSNGYQPYYRPYVKPQKKKDGFAVTSLICGIASLVLCCCSYMGVILGILGVVFANVHKKNNGGKMSGMAVAGLICGILGIVFGALCIVLSLGMQEFWEEFFAGLDLESGTSSFDF